ncbi:MAG TPA: class I SAM-dependent methyltransferase [Gemmatimonadaceae bacterium]|nr:class I SAM-dependent methyltransferase [Gemmatimonadaceae bacterium]
MADIRSPSPSTPPSPSRSPDAEIAASWDANAAGWTALVRRGGIPSRLAGTDDAILTACARAGARAGAHVAAPRVLDVGCGEGWLARALCTRGFEVLGVDGSAYLVARAREAGGPARFEVANYRQLREDPALAAGPWDLVICNFSLFGEHLDRFLAALAGRVAPGGALLVQTVHPWPIAAAEPPYDNGWRRETWSRFGDDLATPMPWYFRTLGSWIALLRAAGLDIASLEEPRDPATGWPLSLLFECRRSGEERK